MHREAEEAFNANHWSEKTKRLITPLKDRLGRLRKRHTFTNDREMSPVERACFFPAIDRAYVYGPHLGKPSAWGESLARIEDALREYGLPKDDD
jgi:hypothetical protein